MDGEIKVEIDNDTKQAFLPRWPPISSQVSKGKQIQNAHRKQKILVTLIIKQELASNNFSCHNHDLIIE